MKINRLLEITILLTKEKRTTAQKLATRFEVSTRTIYRDIDALAEAGVPVYTNKGKGGGICLMEGYTLNSAKLTANETRSLRAALNMLKATKYPNTDEILSKLGTVFSNKEPSWIHIDFTPWGSSADMQEKFNIIKQGILTHYRITFSYYNTQGQKTKRDVEPYFLWYKGKAWYLYAYCTTKLAFRLYRLTRIKQLNLTKAGFSPRKIETSINQKQAGINQQPLTLLFKPNMLYRVYDDFDADGIEIKADGGALVTAMFPVDEWIYGFLLSFGADVEVLEPKGVREELEKRIRRMGKIYT